MRHGNISQNSPGHHTCVTRCYNFDSSALSCDGPCICRHVYACGEEERKLRRWKRQTLRFYAHGYPRVPIVCTSTYSTAKETWIAEINLVISRRKQDLDLHCKHSNHVHIVTCTADQSYTMRRLISQNRKSYQWLAKVTRRLYRMWGEGCMPSAGLKVTGCRLHETGGVRIFGPLKILLDKDMTSTIWADDACSACHMRNQKMSTTCGL